MRGVIQEAGGFDPYEQHATELPKVSKDKQAFKFIDTGWDIHPHQEEKEAERYPGNQQESSGQEGLGSLHSVREKTFSGINKYNNAGPSEK